MKKYTSRAQAPALRPDGLPNRAMKRHHPYLAGQATFRAFNNWYWIAARLCGWIPPLDDEQEKAA